MDSQSSFQEFWTRTCSLSRWITQRIHTFTIRPLRCLEFKRFGSRSLTILRQTENDTEIHLHSTWRLQRSGVPRVVRITKISTAPHTTLHIYRKVLDFKCAASSRHAATTVARLCNSKHPTTKMDNGICGGTAWISTGTHSGTTMDFDVRCETANPRWHESLKGKFIKLVRASSLVAQPTDRLILMHHMFTWRCYDSDAILYGCVATGDDRKPRCLKKSCLTQYFVLYTWD